MRRLCFLVLMMSLLLSGCAPSQQEEAITQFQQRAAQAQSIALEADITADVGGKSFEFSVVYSSTADEARVELVSPETLSGVAAVIRDSGAELEYEGLVLSVGDVSEGISPMTALPKMLGAIENGLFSSVRSERAGEEELSAADFYLTDTQIVTLYLSADGTPRYLTLTDGAAVVAQCAIKSFSMG